ncbi:hypothetical protein [Dipodfec virus UOA04_Rod_951]|nr:hypothetical protein [Dipodfec virus UOA04_Rod_951]
MKIRTIYQSAVVPAHSTTKEVLTVPCDAPSIQELYERAARGEDLGGTYDELEPDSSFDMIHDPDYQDELLVKSTLMNETERIKGTATKVASKRKRAKTDTPPPADNKQVATSGDTERPKGPTSTSSPE